jgi:hypothetical protein
MTTETTLILKPSPIQGVGVFTLRKIKKGEKVDLSGIRVITSSVNLARVPSAATASRISTAGTDRWTFTACLSAGISIIQSPQGLVCRITERFKTSGAAKN